MPTGGVEEISQKGVRNVHILPPLIALAFCSLAPQLNTNLSTNIPNNSYCELKTQAPISSSDGLPIRMLIRLIVLHQQKQLSRGQWEAISALESHKESVTTSRLLDLSTINTEIRLARNLTKKCLKMKSRTYTGR